jgi:hypothetical protein
LNIREQKLESLVWLKRPRDVAPLINPTIWTILSNHFKKGRFNVIHWLCDTKYPIPDKPPKIFAALQALAIPRGYNYFVRNFFETVDNDGNVVGPGIIEKLLTISDFRKKKQDNPNEVHHILRLLHLNREKIFSERLALPNKTLLVVEDTDMAVYVDSNVPIAIDAIESLIGLDDPLNNYSPAMRQNRVIRAIANLAMYYQEFNKKSFSSKEGISRKHLAATRCDWSFRAVISSLTADHHLQEMHLPWGLGIGLLRLHLARKLKDRGWLPNEIWRFLSRWATEYNPLLDELFKEIISESRHELSGVMGIDPATGQHKRGLPTIFQRNPSLGLGSMQLFYITKIKPDAADQTISFSILTVRGFNADYDGKHSSLSLNFSNCGKSLRVFSTNLIQKCISGQRNETGYGNNEKNWVIRIKASKTRSVINDHRNRLVRGQGSRVGLQVDVCSSVYPKRGPKRKASERMKIWSSPV